MNTSDLDEVASAIGPWTKLVWLESPTNPRLIISDIRVGYLCYIPYYFLFLEQLLSNGEGSIISVIFHVMIFDQFRPCLSKLLFWNWVSTL